LTPAAHSVFRAALLASDTKSTRFAPGLALLPVFAALALTLLWPGDALWHIDDPRLLAEAWHANRDGRLIWGGLWGNFGVRYGPFAEWIYQGLLLITHQPVVLLALRALLCAGTTAAGLLWLARELRLPAWFAGAALAAPYVVQFHRQMWDASFCIPLGSLTLAAFVSHLRTGGRGALLVAAAGIFLLPTIHPQALPLAMPLAAGLWWRSREKLREHWKALALLGTVLVALHALWIGEAVYGVVQNLTGSLRHGYPERGARLRCALAPLLGGHLLGGLRSLGQVTTESGPLPLRLAMLGLTLVYPLVWCGIGATAWRLIAQRRIGSTPREAVGTLALAGMAVQALLFGALRIPAHPQYFFGTFAFHLLLAWFGVEALRVWRLGATLAIIYGVAAFIVTAKMADTVHQRGYEPSLGWFRLKDQVSLVRALNAFSDREARTDATFYQKYPQALRALRLFLPPAPGEPLRTSGRLFITQVPVTETRGSALELRELPPEDAPPQNAILDLSPLPKGWLPAAW
jgi:hypothetical protein